MTGPLRFGRLSRKGAPRSRGPSNLSYFGYSTTIIKASCTPLIRCLTCTKVEEAWGNQGESTRSQRVSKWSHLAVLVLALEGLDMQKHFYNLLFYFESLSKSVSSNRNQAKTNRNILNPCQQCNA